MRKITQCLNPMLTTVCARAIELESLTAIIQGTFSAHATARCRVASFNKGCLLLVVDNAIDATELRYQLPALRDYLRKHVGLHQLVTIKINVATDVNLTHPVQPKPKTQPSQLSTQARATLLASSKRCDYQPLRDALARLARTASDN